MKLTSADITISRLTFNSHLNHNPECDILELKISKDAFITYCININTKIQSLEYYAGENFVSNSTIKSNSRHYEENKIPKKYKQVWRALKYHYENRILKTTKIN